MSTTIKFKRGSTTGVNAYTTAKVGEPIYDYDSGRLYIERNDGILFPADLTEISTSNPSNTTVNVAGSVHINQDTGTAYLLISNEAGEDAKWKQIVNDTVQFQLKSINSHFAIPEDNYGITQGPINFSDSGTVELNKNSTWVIN